MEKELKLINWFIDEFRTSKDKEISSVSEIFEIEIGLYSGHIDNMSFDISNSIITLESVSNLFDNKYDVNLEYKIMNDKNLEYLLSELGKERMIFSIKTNNNTLDKFIENMDSEENIFINDFVLIKVDNKYKDFMDKSHKYMGDSRIDGRLIYQVNIELPEFDLIQNIATSIK